MPACPHPSLVQSTTYPVGTRCSQCGVSAEGVLSSVRARLDTAQVHLQEALARIGALEQFETIARQAQRELEQEQLSSATYDKELAETKEQLVEARKQLAQAETHLRNEQHYHQTTKDELEAALQRAKDTELVRKELRAALDREKELHKQLELAERRPATVTSIKK
jgi:chromosome segregation ATPase